MPLRRVPALPGGYFLGVFPAKLNLVAEQPGAAEIVERPQLREVVLDRRAGDYEPVRGRQGANLLRKLRVWVLELVPFVAHDPIPVAPLPARRHVLRRHRGAAAARGSHPLGVILRRRRAQRGVVVEHHAVGGEQHAAVCFDPRQGSVPLRFGPATRELVQVHAIRQTRHDELLVPVRQQRGGREDQEPFRSFAPE